MSLEWIRLFKPRYSANPDKYRFKNWLAVALNLFLFEQIDDWLSEAIL